MAKRTILAGATNQTIDVFIADSSSSVGAGLSGLVYNTSGLKCYYRKGATGSATALTLATQTVGGAHSDGGFVEIDATNMKGTYRLDLSDTIIAATPWVTIYLYGATNMAPCIAEIEIVSYNPFDGVRLGLTALPNAAADAAGGLPISDAGGLDLDTLIGRLDAAISTRSSHAAADVWSVATRVLTANTNLNDPTAAVIAAAVFDLATSGHVTAGTFGAQLKTVLDAVKAVTDALPDAGALSSLATAASIAALNDIAAADVWAVGTRTLTANTNFNDPNAATIAAAIWDLATSGHTTAATFGAQLKTVLDAVKAVTDLLPDAGALSSLATATALATAQTAITAIKAITDAMGATAAANLARTLSAAGTVFFTAQTGTLSTTSATTDLAEATDDHYIGRTIVWLTGVLAGQATDITDYTGSGGQLTYTACTEAPSNGDTGIIV